MKVNELSNNQKASRMISIFNQSEPLTSNAKGIYIGKTKLYNLPFFLDPDELMNPHIAVIGTTGSGKSYFLKNYILRSFNANIKNIFIIDWNDEYSEIINVMYGNVIYINSKNKINVFEIFKNKKKKLDYTVNAISSMLKLDSNEQALLYKVISNAIDKCNASKEKLNFTYILNMLDKDSNLRIKLEQLTSSPILAESSTFNPIDVLNGVYSINISKLNNDSQRKLIVSAFLELIIEFMHNMKLGLNEKRLIIVDEVWKIINDSRDLAQLFREGRKYNIGVAIATQNVKDVPLELVSNIASIFIFRMQNNEDYRILRDAGILAEEFYDASLKLFIGSCIVHLIYKSKDQKNFIIKKVDGLIKDICKINCGSMIITIPIERFLKNTDLFYSKGMYEKLKEFVESNNRDIELIALVKFLVKEGAGRGEIISYLRMLEINDLAIVNALDVVIR
ncbi:MAG: ATP-binding protein [Candidatus Micrarchaeia archaeon]